MSPPRRPIDELVNTDDPGMVVVRDIVAQSPHPVDVLPCDPATGRQTLERLQVTSRSLLGAVSLETGGLWVDHGWLRILGAGSEQLPFDVASFNFGDDYYGDNEHRRLQHVLVVAWDVIGGFFALRQPEPGASPGIHYYAPDSLEWEDLEGGYSAFLAWACSDLMPRFYDSLRWPGWEDEAQACPGNRAIHVVPPLITAGPPIGERSRRPIPVEELWSINQ